MDWSYLAGFIDGEGSLMLVRSGSYRYKNVPRVPTYRPNLAITNNHRGVLEATRDFVGLGRVYMRRRASPHHRDSYIFMASGFRLMPIIQNLLPHLIIKRVQAEVMIAFIERRVIQRTKPFTHEDYSLVQRMQLLNNRHWDHGSPMQPIPEPRPRARRNSVGVPSGAG